MVLGLLAGASCAVAAADDGDVGVSESPSSSNSDSGADQSGEGTNGSTHASNEDANTAGDEPGGTGQNDTGGAEESGDEKGGEKNRADDDSGANDDPGDKSISRIPTLLPEAPPIVDLGPIPEELAPLPLEPMPPVDLPPGPEPVDVMGVGAGAGLPGDYDPPVLTMPVIIAPPPALPGYILGASIAPRAVSAGRAVPTMPRWGGDSTPLLRHTSTGGPLLRELPPTTVGMTARGQASNGTGYKDAGVRRGRLGEMAAGALPGVAGILTMTASGVCLGYRQAAAQRLLTQGSDRFLA
jgi:hypothetical protein